MPKILPAKELLKIDVAGIQMPLEIHYDWRMSIRISLGKDKAILRVPVLTPPIVKEKHIEWARLWIHKKLVKNNDLKNRYIPKEYNSGDILKIYEKEYVYQIKSIPERKSVTGKLNNNIIEILIPENISAIQKEKAISTLLSKIFSSLYLPAVKKRIDYWNEKQFQKEILKVNLRNNQSNWGSCSTNKTISISSRLLLAPPFVLDYIIVHELSHLVHHNHSAKYWALVEKVLPDYMIAEDWLKKNGESIQW